MKTLFAIFIVPLFALLSWSETPSADSKSKAILSYALPSKLDWTQKTDDELGDDMQVFTLGEEKDIHLYSMQTGNNKLWDQFASMDKEKIFQELVAGKKVIHKLMGYKNWTADKNIKKKSEKEIIFEITGNYVDGDDKKFFVEKYYMTPYGFILTSLDWTEKSNQDLAKKAQDEFKNIAFKSEIK